MERLTSAVIGCGRMGAFTNENVRKYSPSCWLPLSHIEALLASDQIDIQAICDVNTELLSKARNTYHIKNTYSDYQQLLDEVQPEILCIATRTPDRADIIKAGIASGVKGFHIEKPLCNSMSQLHELAVLADQYSTSFSYGTVRRYFSIYQQAKNIIDSGRFGKLTQIQINFGSAPLFWTHPHSVDLILFFAGNRTLLSTQAKLNNFVIGKNPMYVESDPTIESATLYFSNDLTGIIGKTNGMDVILSCTEGEVIIEGDGRSIICRSQQGNDPYYPYPGIADTYKEQSLEGTYSAIKHLIDGVNNTMQEKSSNIQSHHIFLGQRALFSFVQSHLTNSQIIPIDDIDEDIFILAKSGDFVA